MLECLRINSWMRSNIKLLLLILWRAIAWNSDILASGTHGSFSLAGRILYFVSSWQLSVRGTRIRLLVLELNRPRALLVLYKIWVPPASLRAKDTTSTYDR